jgi:hypothetical protein
MKIKLECSQICKEMEKPPFVEKIITNADEIESFTKAIYKADKITGMLDYGAVFKMYLSFENGVEKQYVLNIDNEESSLGLIVDLDKSAQGYSVSKLHTKSLREIIYNTN